MSCEDRCEELLNGSVGIVTALNPIIGYQKAASLAKEALKSGRKVSELAVEKGYIKKEDLERILDPYQMTKLMRYASHKEA